MPLLDATEIGMTPSQSSVWMCADGGRGAAMRPSVYPATVCPLQWTKMTSMHAGLVECEAVGFIPSNTTRPQLHVYDRCIQRYR